jgi:thioredoxin
MADRPTRKVIRLRPNVQFDVEPDGTVGARFDVLDLTVSGETEDDAFVAMSAAIREATAASPAAKEAWDAYVAGHTDVVELTDDEIAERRRRIDASHEASKGFGMLTLRTLDAAIAGDEPLLVDFWAEWCMPCHALAPVLREAADRLEGRMRVAKINVDENEGLWERFGIRGIPTMILFRKGEELHRLVGSGRTKEQMLAELEPHLG